MGQPDFVIWPDGPGRAKWPNLTALYVYVFQLWPTSS